MQLRYPKITGLNLRLVEEKVYTMGSRSSVNIASICIIACCRLKLFKRLRKVLSMGRLWGVMLGPGHLDFFLDVIIAVSLFVIPMAIIFTKFLTRLSK